MRKLTVIVLGIIIILNLPPAKADEISEETHDINLYIFGEGGDPSPDMQSNPSGNLSTMAPNTSTNEYQILHPESSPPEIYYWFSDPLKADISIDGDVHFTIWAICSSPRYLHLELFFEIIKSEGGGGGHGAYTSNKLVYDEPVEFNALLSEENLDGELKQFHTGDRMGIGIEADYHRPQPPAEVKILYNSINYPSHMTINSTSISTDISNLKTLSEKASIDIMITNAFGVYDITDYDIQITGPSGKNISNLEIRENKILEEGKIELEVLWSKSEDGNGNHIIRTMITDNNNNHWDSVETLELNFLDEGSGNTFSPILFSFIGIGIFIAILLYSYILRKRKKQ